MTTVQHFKVLPRVTAEATSKGGGSGGGGGGGGGGCATAPGCDCLVQLPDTTKGAAPESLQLLFGNPLSHPITISGVQVQTDHPEVWTVDDSQLKGTLQPGDSRVFTVTFLPPAK